MEDIPINLGNILEQAPKWTFAGDFTLLQWMKQISQDLESRATKTAEGLAKLNHNIKSTNVALDNVANRLTALQFGNQFVESRVQDDDETLINTSDNNKDNQNQPEQTTPKQVLLTFLDNNLKVLRNCHERYSIDLEDSDDEENTTEKTCIYQPINPYNERPLPYIFGSKDWHSNWHVGLYENQAENSCSGDEISEVFSESSSTSRLDDNESFESNTEWASSNSIDNENVNANIEVKNASSLQGSQALYPGTPLPVNAVKSKATLSETSSISTSSSLVKKSLQQTAKQNENVIQRSESINSINSKNSISKGTTLKRENVLQYKIQPQQFVDLFAEPPEDFISTRSSSVSSASIITQNPDNNRRESGKENPPVFRSQPAPFVDIFAEPPEDFIIPATTSIHSNPSIKRRTVNLFDEDEHNMNEDDILSVLTKNEAVKEKPIVTNKPPAIVQASKSLFDDSDDDDDFLKAFVKNSAPKAANNSSLTKTLLFDNEINEPSINLKLPKTNTSKDLNITSKKRTQNVFDDTEDNGDVLDFNKPEVEKISKRSLPTVKLLDKAVVEEGDKNITKKVNLFDDLDEEDDLFSAKLEKNKSIPQQTSNKKTTVNKEELSEKNATVTNEIDFDQTAKNQLENTSELPANNSIHKEDLNRPEEVVSKSLKISKTINPEVAKVFKNTDTDSLQTDNNLTTKESLSKPSNQKELNDNNPAPSLKQDTLASVPANKDEKPIAANKYDFNSVLFLDEPPEDDDAFFETLAKTPNTLNSNYNTIDLENDVYEPELPKVPGSSTSNNQTDAIENTFYTGLQLFSDTPPDDDDGDRDDDVSAGRASNLASDVTQTKRLHSVFYDDFNETLMALNQQHTEKEKEASQHSNVNDEPLLMNEGSNSSSQDMTDHKVPDDKQDTIKADNKNTAEVSNKRPVSKLIMPNININIQALLPGANNTLRKPKEDNINPYNDDDIKSDINTLKRPVGANEVTISEPPRTAETEHILPNVTKNRIKGPATRRPSTRRARQENYRKSLIEQQKSLESEDEKSEIQNEIIEAIKPPPKTSIPQKTTSPEKPYTSINVQKHNLGRSNPAYVTTTSATSKLYEDKREESPKKIDMVKDKVLEDTTNFFKETARPKHSSLLFEDEKANDDDFFEHIKTSHTSVLDSNKAPQAKKTLENTSAITSSKVSEANASISSLLLAGNINIEETKEKGIEFSTEITQGESIAKEHESNQPTQLNATAAPKPQNQLTTNKLKSFLDDDDDDYDDNDLFKTTLLQRSTIAISNKERNIKAKSQFKSFLDSETDEEESTTAAQKTKTSIPVEEVTSTEMPKVSIPTPNKSNTKLFSDSETDSDDLFGKLSSTKTSNTKISSTESTATQQTKTKPQSSSLFGDESDSDDFLKSSNTTSKSALKKNVPKPTALQTNTSLFSDLESDEDDLFGGGPAKVTTATVKNIQHVKAAPVPTKPTSAAEVSKSKNVDDNPLADLL